eukprot:2931367-Pleurochrysis_carterae.AAC.1
MVSLLPDGADVPVDCEQREVAQRKGNRRVRRRAHRAELCLAALFAANLGEEATPAQAGTHAGLCPELGGWSITSLTVVALRPRMATRISHDLCPRVTDVALESVHLRRPAVAREGRFIHGPRTRGLGHSFHIQMAQTYNFAFKASAFDECAD